MMDGSLTLGDAFESTAREDVGASICVEKRCFKVSSHLPGTSIEQYAHLRGSERPSFALGHGIAKHLAEELNVYLASLSG